MSLSYTQIQHVGYNIYESFYIFKHECFSLQSTTFEDNAVLHFQMFQ